MICSIVEVQPMPGIPRDSNTTSTSAGVQLASNSSPDPTAATRPTPGRVASVRRSVMRTVGESPHTKTEDTYLISARKHTLDRKSTRLNSSHVAISYAVFSLKYKKIDT